MSARLAAALALALPAIALPAGKELEGERAAAMGACPSPEEAARRMSVPAGYEVRCFAHEPMVVNPVAMTWDARGRLWVVEGYEYPEGSKFKDDAFGGEAKDDRYHPVPAACTGKEASDPGARIPRDRVLILEDTDNDGVADKRTVFLQGLDMGSALLVGDGGAYVGQQPHLIHFRDSDGDDHADEWRVCLTGFGREDTHELLNSFCWGPDGWLYMTHGVFTNSRVRRPGEPKEKGFKFDAGMGRARPARSGGILPPDQTKGGRDAAPPWEFEVFADGTSNPWGCDYDARGNFFVSACVIDHLFHMAPGGIYQRQGGAPENPYAYELLPSIVKHRHFRAAYAGVQIYQGGVYPEDTWGHCFIGNIHDNSIHEEVLTPVGATFKAEPRRDFLRANDGWFRPVSTQTGPDGFLWVMDWCDKYPCYQNAKANPEGVDREHGRIWRIVHVGKKVEATPSSPDPVPDAPSRRPANRGEGAANTGKSGDGAASTRSRESRDMDLGKLPAPDLVRLLGHPNNWMRRMARRMLVERRDGVAHTPLMGLLKSGPQPSARAEAFWTLIWLGGARDLVDAVDPHDPDPTMKIWQARLIGELFAEFQRSIRRQADFPHDERLPEHMALKLEELAGDKDPAVQLAIATAMVMADTGFLTVNRAGDWKKHASAYVNGQLVMGNLLKAAASSESGLLPFAIWRVIEPQMVRRQADMNTRHDTEWLDWLSGVAPNAQPVSRVLTHKSMRRLCDTRDAKNLDLAVAFCERIQSHEILLAHALDGLVKGQEAGVLRPTVDVSKPLAAWRASRNADVRRHAQNLAVLWGDPAAVRELADMLLDAGAPGPERVAALQMLRKVKNDAARAAYAKLLARRDGVSPSRGVGEAPTLLGEAIRAASDLGGDDTPGALLALWKNLAPAQRAAAAEALVSREPWASALLDAVRDKRIAASDIPMTARRALATHRNREIKKRADELLGQWRESPEDIKALIAAKRKACLEGDPDLAAGKLAFTATCAVCHSFHGGGQKVGPDLIGSGRSNLDALLANVIDPNQIIGNGYENIVVTARDGRTITGRLTENTPGHVKLLAIAGAEQVVPRDQIARLENTRQSVMPLGFGALPDDVFRSLIWYVLAPPEEGPLTAEKKKLLSQGLEGGVAAKRKPPASSTRAIDREGVSLWNPAWKVEAPDFERTPMKLAEFHGRTNVLLMHPFSKEKPCALERRAKVGKDGLNKLSFYVAAHDQGDWELRVTVDSEIVREEAVGHDGERWRRVEVDLRAHAGREVVVRLEGSIREGDLGFSYWGDLRLD